MFGGHWVVTSWSKTICKNSILHSNKYEAKSSISDRKSYMNSSRFPKATGPQIFGRSVNPIPTGGWQIIPTYYYWHPQYFSPSGITEQCSSPDNSLFRHSKVIWKQILHWHLIDRMYLDVYWPWHDLILKYITFLIRLWGYILT